jgi:hypothetical protein
MSLLLYREKFTGKAKHSSLFFTDVNVKEKRFVNKKHSSLFAMSVSDKEKLYLTTNTLAYLSWMLVTKKKGVRGYSISK